MNCRQYLQDDTYAIFLFHGVIEEDDYEFRNSSNKHLEEENFRKILEGLRLYGNPVSMEEIVKYHRECRRLPKRSFAVTFDDGFENNYSIAMPILIELNIPATFYITSDFVDKNLMSWIDRIEYCIDKSDVIKKQEMFDNYRFWGKSKERDVNGLADECFLFYEIANVKSSNDPLDKKMNWEQVRELSKNPLFTIGGHTKSHKILSYLSFEEKCNEIAGCYNKIQKEIDVDIKHFSYPEGQVEHYDSETVALLQTYEYDCCSTAIHGVNRIEDDLFHLNRIEVK